MGRSTNCRHRARGVARSCGAGLLCLLDDLHAADQASLELLVLLAGDVQRLPILIAATLRDTEPSEALDRTLGELLTLRGAERLAVAPLALAEVDAPGRQSARGERRPEGQGRVVRADGRQCVLPP